MKLIFSCHFRLHKIVLSYKVKLTVIMLLDRFKFFRAANDFSATVGKSVMKFSEISNFSKFSVP